MQLHNPRFERLLTPDMTGLSARNLKYMRALAEAHPDHAFVQQVVSRLPWGHVIRLLENVKDVTRREWYARQAIEHGWSRNVLIHQICGLFWVSWITSII